jgi:predicted ATPase
MLLAVVREATASGTPIRTPDQRLRVFVSSTLGELADERAAARRAIERLRLTPVMFELGARPHPARALYRSYLAQSHVFVGLYWERYGWVAPDETISGLEDEYMLSSSLPRLVYLKDPAPAREPRLAELIERIRADDTVAYKRFETAAEIERLLTEDLALLLSERFIEPDEPGATAWGVRLPLPPSPIIGRDLELAALRLMLTSPAARLVTLVGPGGVGKTRLALEVARDLAGGFRDGAVMVKLDGARDGDEVLPTIAAAMGVTIEAFAAVEDILVKAIGSRHVLLLLDNVEHVLDAAPSIGRLLERCPNLTLLATSRTPIGLRAEQEFPVEPLGLPETATDDSAAAVRLFVERARGVRHDLVLDDDDARLAVCELCQRLEGLPLAIELAAARVRLLTPRELLERLDERFEILATSAREAPERQRTLRATIEWSYDLLDESERRLLRLLSVFEGGFTLEDVDCVSYDDADVLDTLSGLVDHSLVSVRSADDASVPRFGMFNMIRAFARERLEASEEAATVRTRHLACFAGLASKGAAGLRSPEFDRWMDRIGPEWENLRAAWRHAIDVSDGPRAVELGECAFVFMWALGRFRELDPLIEATLAAVPPVDESSRAAMLVGGALVKYSIGDYDAARRNLDAFDAVRDALQDDSLAGAAALYGAFLAAEELDVEAILRGLDDAERLLRAAGDEWTLGFCPGTRGVLAYVVGDFDAAARYEREALELAERSGNEVLALQALVFQVMVKLSLDDMPGARALLGRTLDYVERHPYWDSTAYAYEAAAGVSLEDGEVERAAQLIGAANTVRETSSSTIWPLVRALRDRIVEQTVAELGDERYAAGVSRGVHLGPPRAVALAREVVR